MEKKFSIKVISDSCGIKAHTIRVWEKRYGVFSPESEYLGYMLDSYFESKHNVYNYLHSIIQKGAKNTINITNSFEDYFHIDEYYPGIGIVSERNHAKVKNFFNDKRENLSNIIKNK